MTFNRDLLRGYEAEVRVAAYLMAKGYAVWHVEHTALQQQGIDLIFANSEGAQRLVQVKRDDRAIESKNIFWEVKQHGKPGWGCVEQVESSPSDWWCWVIGPDLLWLRKEKVLDIAKTAEKWPIKHTRHSSGRIIPTTEVFLK